MMKRFLLALPIASVLLFAGCNETSQSSSGYTGSGQAPAAPAQQPQSQQMQQQQASYRRSTTQSLPSGWGYLHEQDLTGGRLVVNSTPTQPSPSAANTGGSGS